MKEIVQSYRKGRKSFFEGLTLKDNPYKLISPKRKAWRYGYSGLRLKDLLKG